VYCCPAFVAKGFDLSVKGHDLLAEASDGVENRRANPWSRMRRICPIWIIRREFYLIVKEFLDGLPE